MSMSWKARLTIRLVVTTGLTALALVKAAYAQGTEAAPALTPPRLVKFVEADYPPAAGAAGQQAAVDLELTVDANGAVTAAAVVAPVGQGFDEAALAAARQFLFEPARRGDQAIPARIRYRYQFEIKAPAPPPPTTGVLEGRVLLRGGDDVVLGAEVTVSSEDGAITRKTRTAPDGSFEIGELPGGLYSVRVAGHELAPIDAREEVTAGDATSVTYRLLPAERRPAGQLLEFGATATIEAPPREVTKRSLKAEELLRAAGTRGDPLRAIEYMPGIARGNGDMVIIRGSSPADTEVNFEGVPVYRLYHFGGLTSFVHGRLLDRIELYPGNFSPRFGRKMGGVIDVGMRDPKSDGYHGIADVNLIDSSLLVEGPIGKRASIAISAKRSYMDFFFERMMPEEVGVTAAPVYWDYQLLASWRPTDRDRLRFMIYGSADQFKLVLNEPADGDPAVRGKLNEKTDFHRLHTQWQHRFSDAVEHDVTLSGGPFSFGMAVGPEVFMDVPGQDAYLRGELRARLHPRMRIIAGVDAQYLRFDGKYFGPALEQFEGNPDLEGPLGSKSNVSLDRVVSWANPAGYLELILQPTDRWQIVPGLRTDYFGDIAEWTVDPRLTSRFELQPGTTVKGGVGLFSQEPSLGEALPVIGNPKLGTSRAEHYGFGVEQKLGERLVLTAEGFYKRLSKLVVGSPVPGEYLNNDGIGRIWGAEASARLQPSKRTTGFLSYTLSRSRRRDHQDESWRAFNWDQTHILTMAGSLRLGRGWDLSSTFRYVTGNPYTPVVAATYNANTDLYRPSYGQVNSGRDPAFHRLDLRIEKAWQVSTGSIAAYLDVQNAYNHRAQEGRAYNYDYRQSKAIPGLPVIPSLGVRGEL